MEGSKTRPQFVSSIAAAAQPAMASTLPIAAAPHCSSREPALNCKLQARPHKLSLTGLESLTAQERRISEMAAEGLSNPEIAQNSLCYAKDYRDSHVPRLPEA